jgi:phosphomannomutase
MTAFMKLQNGSDIRGIASEGVEGENVNLTPQIARQIGYAFANWLAKKSSCQAKGLKIGVGRDSRITGPDLAAALMEGIIFAGASVVDCGMATTPSMFMSIVFKETAFTGSAMITASHLPFNRNGIKFFNKDGGLEHDDITEILSEAEKADVGKASAEIKSVDLISIYAEYLKDKIASALKDIDEKQPLKGLHIVVDSGNGASGFFVEKILKPLGADTTGSQFLEPDGMFPNHIPNPENKQAMEAIRNAVLNNKADLGLIFDTDVDRMSAVLSDGREINRDSIIAMIAAILAPEYPGSTIITDSITSDRLTYFLEDVLGLKHLCYKRGYKNVIDKQKELNASGTVAPLAMETSGHGALKDNYFLDDGAFLAVKLIIALAQASVKGKNLSSLIEKLPPLVEDGEFRFKIKGEDFKEYGLKVLDEFKKRASDAGYTLPHSYEGVRISFNSEDIKGWMLLRLSLHDPVMPLNIEGARKGDLAKLVEIAKKLTDGFDRLERKF